MRDAQPADPQAERESRARDPFRELMARIDAITGRPLAIIAPTQLLTEALGVRGADPDPARALGALLDDGTRLRTRVHELIVEPVSDAAVRVGPVAQGPPRGDPSRWLGQRWTWRTRELTPDAPRPGPDSAALLLIIDPPLGTSSKGLWLGRTRVDVQWLPTPRSVADADSRAASAWRAVVPIAWAQRPALVGHMAIERDNPLTAWRARLAVEGLAPSDLPAGRAEAEPLELLAQQQGQRWQLALARLHAVDPAVCEQVRTTLARVVEVAPGVAVPAWPQGIDDLQLLLEDLLDPALAPARRVELARAWVARQPTAAAWISHDAAAIPRTFSASDPSTPEREATWTQVAALHVANLTAQPQAVWVGVEDGADGPGQPEPVPALESVALLVPIAPPAGLTPVLRLDASGGGDADAIEPASGLRPFAPNDADAFGPVRPSIMVRAGGWRQILDVLGARAGVGVAVRPPGLSTGPFDPDPTLASWLSARPENSEPDWQVAAMLHRMAGEGQDLAPARRWELFVEARTPAGSAPASGSGSALPGDWLYVYVGPPGAPSSAWRISRDGEIATLREGERSAWEELGLDARARVVTLADRWTARITLPPGAVDERGLVWIGLCRVDSRGVRSCWPRAIPFWQDEPPRALLNVSGWGVGGTAPAQPEAEPRAGSR